MSAEHTPAPPLLLAEDMQRICSFLRALAEREADAQGRPYSEIERGPLSDKMDAIAGGRAIVVQAPVAPPLALLQHPPAEFKGLLLQSLHGTHAELLSFDDFHAFKREGHDVVEGDFTHKPSGRRFSIQIVEIPEAPHA